jgi:hypothetical protein
VRIGTPLAARIVRDPRAAALGFTAEIQCGGRGCPVIFGTTTRDLLSGEPRLIILNPGFRQGADNVIAYTRAAMREWEAAKRQGIPWGGFSSVDEDMSLGLMPPIQRMMLWATSPGALIPCCSRRSCDCAVHAAHVSAPSRARPSSTVDSTTYRMLLTE